MSIKEVKGRLEAACKAIDTLDADLAAGRVTADEHARRRAEREREAGRLFVDLRRAQQATRERPAEPLAPAPAPPPSWLRHPVVLVPVAGLLIIVGVVGGVVVGRRFIAPTPAAVSGGGAPEPGAPPASSPEIELQALRAVVARDDAPIPTLLQFAHLSLDLGRLGDARRTYDRVLARDPRNAEAITHVGAVLYAEGKVDEALGKVEEALRIDPQYVHALWDRVQYQLRGKRDFAATVKAGEAFLAVVPSGPDADNIRKMMAEARQQAGK